MAIVNFVINLPAGEIRGPDAPSAPTTRWRPLAWCSASGMFSVHAAHRHRHRPAAAARLQLRRSATSIAFARRCGTASPAASGPSARAHVASSSQVFAECPSPMPSASPTTASLISRLSPSACSSSCCPSWASRSSARTTSRPRASRPSRSFRHLDAPDSVPRAACCTLMPVVLPQHVCRSSPDWTHCTSRHRWLTSSPSSPRPSSWPGKWCASASSPRCTISF